MTEQRFFVYILASRKDGALYVGSCNDLRQRVEQHCADAVSSHTEKYGIHTLVYFETHETHASARSRELLVKKWRRAWKIELVETINPQWRDLSGEIPL